MRNSLLALTLLITLTTSCRSDRPIGPPDLLYRQWRLFRTREVAKSDWQQRNMDASYTVEYSADGTIIYRLDGVQTQAGCCKPNKFSRQGVVVNYSEWQPCYNVLCGIVKQAMIDQLTDTQLELNDGYIISQYELVN